MITQSVNNTLSRHFSQCSLSRSRGVMCGTLGAPYCTRCSIWFSTVSRIDWTPLVYGGRRSNLSASSQRRCINRQAFPDGLHSSQSVDARRHNLRRLPQLGVDVDWTPRNVTESTGYGRTTNIDLLFVYQTLPSCCSRQEELDFVWIQVQSVRWHPLR